MKAEERIIGWVCERHALRGRNVEVRPDTNLLESGLLDSLDFLHLVTFIEEEYQLEFPIEMLTPDNFATPKVVGEVVERIAGNG